MLDVAAAALTAPMVVVAWIGAGVVQYAWALALGQIVAACMALCAASSVVRLDWVRSVLVPPSVSTVVAVGSVLMVKSFGLGLPSVFWWLIVDTCVYGLSLGCALRTIFPDVLATLLSFMPQGDRVGGWLRLHAMFTIGKDRA
jgi:hypothetical protein